MYDILKDLSEQANRICDELINAKRAAKNGKGAAAAYQKGRAEELKKWLHSVEEMIEKIMEARKGRNNEQ